MRYTKINLELIVVADEAEAVVGELNAALDRMDEKHTLFGGGIETAARTVLRGEAPNPRRRPQGCVFSAAGNTPARR